MDRQGLSDAIAVTAARQPVALFPSPFHWDKTRHGDLIAVPVFAAGRSPIRWDSDYEAYLLDQWQHGTFDDFWKRPGLWAAGYYYSFPKVPIIFMSSWYDAYVQTTTENYLGLKGKADRPLKLIMGPWTHGNPLAAHLRRRGFRAGGDVRRTGRRRLAHLSPEILLPLAEGRAAG